MMQQMTPSDTASDSVSRTRKHRIIFATLAALVLIGGLLFFLPGTESHQSLFDRMRRGFDEHRHAFDKRRRAWEEQRRTEEQAKRAAATAASQKADPLAPVHQRTNP